MSSLEDKVETLKLVDDIENMKPNNDEDTLKNSAAVVETGIENGEVTVKKKNKKKKKNNKPEIVTDEPVAETATALEEDTNILGEVDGNSFDGKLCAFCKKAGPIKRCSKRHPKCLAKMFCNDTCESLAHEDKKAALVKKEKAKVAAAKKKGMKNKDWKNTDSGQFWWHDQ